ncbi:uncharacterized protein LOC131928357 [Physella acuta]|uniref:uncharacterized protein LOC131928357 n=1 Tax=Physella acuta TaxID=109671 RepID=UPI0027DD2B2F|nr:uncharacterized protein LOC131928357 [Physella acuta]
MQGAERQRKSVPNTNAALFEILSWKRQREIEQFVKKNNIKHPIWLDGRIGHLAFRERTVSLFWTSTFYPPISNFKNGLPHFVGQTMCVYLDPMENYSWNYASCSEDYHAVVCTKKRGKKFSPITTTVAPIPDVVL